MFHHSNFLLYDIVLINGSSYHSQGGQTLHFLWYGAAMRKGTPPARCRSDLICGLFSWRRAAKNNRTASRQSWGGKRRETNSINKSFSSALWRFLNWLQIHMLLDRALDLCLDFNAYLDGHHERGCITRVSSSIYTIHIRHQHRVDSVRFSVQWFT